jgi:hypothetical protein
MGALYQSPMDQLAIRFGALSLNERPETQVPGDMAVQINERAIQATRNADNS